MGLLAEFNFIKGNFLLIVTGWLLIDFTREMAFTYYPLYVSALGGTPTVFGLIGATSTIIQAVMRIAGGSLADKYQRKPLIVSMTAFTALAYLIYALAPSWEHILLGAVLASLATVYLPSFDSIIMDSLPSEKRGTGYSIINLITQVSTTPSPLIAGLLYSKLGVSKTSRIAFLLVVLAYLIASATRLRLTEDPSKPWATPRDLAQALTDTQTLAESIKVWREVHPTLRKLQAIELVFQIPNTMFNTVLVYFLVDDLGISEIELSRLVTLIGLAVIVFAIPAGRTIDRYGRVKPLILAHLATLLTLSALLLRPGFKTLAVLTPIIALLNVVFYTASQALWADLTPQTKRGKVLGNRGFLSLVASSIGSATGGLIYDQVGHNAPLLLYIAGSLASLLLTSAYIREPKERVE